MVQLDDRATISAVPGRSVRRWTAARIAAGIAVAAFLAGVAAIVLARWWTGTGYAAAPAGLPDPGQLTAVALPISHLASETAGMLVVGLLVVRWLSPAGVSRDDHRLGTLTSRWAWGWAAWTAVWIVFTMSDMTGLPVSGLPGSPDLVAVVLGTQRILAQVATLWVAVAIAMFAGRVTSRPALGGVTGLALLALLPSALTGHAGHHNETSLTVSALAVHVVAAAVWVGGLLAIVLYLRSEPRRLRAVLPRFSSVALVCAIAVAASGVIVSVVMLGNWSALLESNRGHLIITKAAALLVLVGFGYWHRRTTVPRAGRGDLLPLLRLAGVEVVLMGATIGVAVALSTTP